MTRKIISLLLALCLLLPADALAEAAPAAYPIVDQPIIIQGVCFGDNQGTDTHRILWDEIEKLTNIRVEWTFVSYEQRGVYLAMGDWPDLFHNSFDSNTIEEYGVQAGMLVNLLDYIELMPNLQKTYADYPGARKMALSSNGGIYQFPRINSATTAANCRWQYRYDKLEALGLSVLKTVDEYYRALAALKNASGEAPICDNLAPRHGFQGTAGGEWFHCAAFGASNNPNFEDNGVGTVVYNRMSEQYRRYLQFMNKLYAEGLLHQEYLTMDNTTRLSCIESGATVFGMDAWGNVSKAEVFQNGFTDLRQLAPLTSEYDDTQTVAGYPVVSAIGCVISARSPYVKEICRMMDIFYAQDEVSPGTGLYGVAGTYGPENITWYFSNDDKTEWDYILPEGYSETGTTYQWTNVIIGNNFGRFDGFMSSAFNGAMSNGRARQMSYVQGLIPYQEAEQFPAGKMAFTEEEQNVIFMYETEIRSHVDEWTAWFIAGTKDPGSDADWQEYVSAFESMHLSEVIQAYQTAYARYLAL